MDNFLYYGSRRNMARQPWLRRIEKKLRGDGFIKQREWDELAQITVPKSMLQIKRNFSFYLPFEAVIALEEFGSMLDPGMRGRAVMQQVIMPEFVRWFHEWRDGKAQAGFRFAPKAVEMFISYPKEEKK